MTANIYVTDAKDQVKSNKDIIFMIINIIVYSFLSSLCPCICANPINMVDSIVNTYA